MDGVRKVDAQDRERAERLEEENVASVRQLTQVSIIKYVAIQYRSPIRLGVARVCQQAAVPLKSLTLP